MSINVSEILKDIGIAAGVFNPLFGNGLIAIGSILDEFDGIPDNVLEEKFIGFNKSANIIKELVKKYDFEKVDRESLLLIAENLENMSLFLEKIFKILK